jgi:glucokinase
VIVGLDVREAAATAVVVAEDGAVVARSVEDGSSDATVPQAIRAIVRDRLSSLGIAVGHPLDAAIADVAAAAARAGGAGVTPVVVTQGTALALAEQWCGAARGAGHVAALAITDTVHAGIVVNGQPFQGSSGMAGAAAWLALNPVEREDYRTIGCLEAEIGTAGIVRRLIWRLKAGDRSRVLDMSGGVMAAITVQQIFDAARGGDGVAISVVRDTARYIGMAVGNLVAILDPDVVVLGSLIAVAEDLLLEPARAEAGRRMPPPAVGRVRIVTATLGADAVAIGAARAAMLATSHRPS